MRRILLGAVVAVAMTAGTQWVALAATPAATTIDVQQDSTIDSPIVDDGSLSNEPAKVENDFDSNSSGD
jgi:hypothetical protein